ncbi:hypothetical protein DW322_05430 [Rhodococcus rhodnii]|nr:hypothetical protein DW322_05430 [Rhodococcus rhodnii]
MRPWMIVVTTAAVVIVIGVAAVLVFRAFSGGDGEPTAAQESTSPAPAAAPAPSQAAPRELPTNGILKVGSDITPGEYATTPTGSAPGYWERLSCLSGDFECVITNDLVEGQGYLTVAPTDLAVRVSDLRLEKTSDAVVTASGRAPAPAPDVPGSSPDTQGFATSPRCNSDDPAVVTAETTQSRVVICETGAGRLYYKGARISDGAAIEIDDPTPSGSGYEASGEAGTVYRIGPDALVITQGGQQIAQEPTLSYRTR